MREAPSLPEMIDRLRQALAFHQEREAFHAQQQAHYAQQEKVHGEQRAHHAAEVEATSKHLEELRELSERLGVVLQKTGAVPPETEEQALGKSPRVSKALDRVLETWPPDIPFSASTMAYEVTRRYGAILRRTVDMRVIANSLRRRCDKGLLREVRGGRPYQETLYQKAR
jgi:hypothetical protein